MNVMLLGATGLVGRECLALLLANPQVQQIQVLLRRALTPDELIGPGGAAKQGSKLHIHVVDFDHLDDLARERPSLFQVDAAICALGTTIKQAGSQTAFKRVDHGYPLAAARCVRAHGCQHFLLVSAMGANAASPVFYNRIKGNIENDIAILNFAAVTIARPSLLLGDRAEFRLAEKIMGKLAWLIPPPWTPVHVRQVARGLVGALQQPPAGRRILSNVVLREQSDASVNVSTGVL